MHYQYFAAVYVSVYHQYFACVYHQQFACVYHQYFACVYHQQFALVYHPLGLDTGLYFSVTPDDCVCLAVRDGSTGSLHGTSCVGYPVHCLDKLQYAVAAIE